MTMSDDDQNTAIISPQTPQFDHGWQAWQAVIGRLAAHDSPDARLRIEVVGRAGTPYWAVEAIWSAHIERAADHTSLGEAMKALSAELGAHHWEFHDSRTGLARYDVDDWLDADTAGSLARLVDTVQAVFAGGWSLSFTYQPVEMADQRVQGRLVARAGSVAVAGRGRTLIDAVRDVFRSAAPHFAKKP